jgi:putative phosphoribosyl transferase
MLFQDRRHAGRMLAAQLARYAGRPDVVVLGLPRGGVPVAAEVARGLGAPLDLFLVRKIGVPGYEELAMGAVASGGVSVRNESVLRDVPVRAQAFHEAEARELDELNRRERVYREGSAPIALEGKIAILVDDGLATGSTMRAAVKGLRKRHAAKVIAAAPVGTDEAVERLEQEADEVICPATPEPFRAVGLWYQDFRQISDDEVIELLRHSREETTWPSEANR